MATRFDFESVFEEKNWYVLYPDANTNHEKYLMLCKNELARVSFPNIEYEIEEFKSGGLFTHVEKTQMLAVSFKKSQFNKLGIYFRAQPFGNTTYYSLLKTIDKGFWSGNISQLERLNNIRDKCKNQAQKDEFQALGYLGDLIFLKAMRALDPSYTENKYLFEPRF